MTEEVGGRVERFAARAADHGVEVHRVSVDEAAAAIEGALRAPAVGAPLPWRDLALPGAVTTHPSPAELDAATTGVTAARLGVAEYGSLLLESTSEGSEPVSLFPERHVAVLRERDIAPDLEAAFDWLGRELRSTRGSMVLATGPSATADMGSLVTGAHGPSEVVAVLVR